MALIDTIKKYGTERGRVLLAAIALVAAVAAVVAAQGFGDASRTVHRQRARGGAQAIGTLRQELERGSPWLDLLKIRDDQRTQLLEIIDRHEPAFLTLESKRSRLAEEFASAFTANASQPPDVEQWRAEIRTLNEQAIDETLAVANEAGQLLSAEQRARLVRLWLAH